MDLLGYLSQLLTQRQQPGFMSQFDPNQNLVPLQQEVTIKGQTIPYRTFEPIRIPEMLNANPDPLTPIQRRMLGLPQPEIQF